MLEFASGIMLTDKPVSLTEAILAANPPKGPGHTAPVPPAVDGL